MKKLLKRITGPLAFALALVLSPATAFAATPINVPLSPTAQASANNVIVTVTGSDVRVQFDYDLVNGATTATVDAALNGKQSFGPVTVTGPGHYDATLSLVTNGTYTIYIFITGNPDFLVPGSTVVGPVVPPAPPHVHRCDRFKHDTHTWEHSEWRDD